MPRGTYTCSMSRRDVVRHQSHWQALGLGWCRRPWDTGHVPYPSRHSEQFTCGGHNSTALSEVESILFCSLCVASQLWVPLCFSFVDSVGVPPPLVTSDMSYSQTQVWIFNLSNQWDSHNSFMRKALIFNTVLISLLIDV